MRNNKATHAKAIIFDLGNVLIFFDHKRASKPMAKKLGVSEKKVFEVLSGRKSNFIDFCEKSKSEKEYWDLFAKILDVPKISPKTLQNIWNTISWLNPQTLRLLSKLRKTYKLGLLSNINVGHKNYLLKKYKLQSKFDVLTFSCDIGVRKPAPKIYQTTLSKLNTLPEETLFIDDLSKNIKGAKKVGMQTILFKSNKQLFKQLKRLGVKV